MKWNDVRVLVISAAEDGRCKALINAANAWADRYNVPSQHRIFDGYGRKAGFVKTATGSLSGMTSASKLIIIGHANAHGIEQLYAKPFCPFGLVNYLHRIGLRQVGLIALKCCLLGRGDYLERFVEEADGRLEIGWCIGYRDVALTREGHEYVGYESHWRDLIPSLKLPDSWRVRIVRGTIPVVPPNAPSRRFPPLPV
ncbi:MAG: hypothetical protein CL858_04290 [Cupriavidus sp.]|jgi:hypothetical protein|uniref:hypothetical protein n=1 Tax=Cupriavidus pauculus TaxID=82633 RepID=UPI00078087B8|nr:hypothetical protein [Cupriavidus pauculus]MBU64675.1 hypothetical protein [Cupriavidus sp.]KAB0604301.1 hypothetical protein F7R19_05670 [Cupriavidus pauculus]MBY4733842.1 hypothetical protein [Cupriavidus pauculus]MCM3606571.1 hypothetical protein [Cupriavidus pauculus]UAL00656.1 hypothetical protein K8O84_04685 [Cupriavidus pauculus]